MAFWRYKEETKEFDCIESFRIDEPLPFRDMNFFSGKRNQKTFFFRTQHTNEIFWFSECDESIYLSILTGSKRQPSVFEIDYGSELY